MIRNIIASFFTIIIPLYAVTSAPGICETIEFDRTYSIDTDTMFVVDLDIDAAEIDVKRSEEFNECRVHVEYDSERFEPWVEYNADKNRLEVTIDCHLLKCENCDDDHHGCGAKHDTCCTNNCKMEIVIELPYGPRTDIRADIKAGDIDFELGGLSIERFRLSCLAGETKIDFDRPNRIVCKRFDVNTKIGETNLKRLGNARFDDADINGGIGEMNIDFSGEKIRDAYAKIDLDIGETEIIVPENIGTKIRVSRFILFSNADCPCGFRKRGHNYYSEHYDDYGDRLTIRVSAGIGELDIRTADGI